MSKIEMSFIKDSSAVIERTTVCSGRPFNDFVSSFEREVGKWDESVGQQLLEDKAPWTNVQSSIAKMSGTHGLIILHKADQGAITSLSGKTKECSLYLVGNPVIANQILDIDPLACLYVPFRVALYHDGEESLMSYDRPSSFLGALNNSQLFEIGKKLDEKIDLVANIVAAL